MKQVQTSKLTWSNCGVQVTLWILILVIIWRQLLIACQRRNLILVLSLLLTGQDGHLFYIKQEDVDLAEQLEGNHISEYSQLDFNMEWAHTTIRYLKLLKH